MKAAIPRLRPVHVRRMAVALGIALGAYLLVAYGILPLVWMEVERGHHPALEGLPEVTYDADGIPADPLNVALVGDEAEVVAAMLAAHWHPADPITLRSSLKIAESVVLHRPDPDGTLFRAWALAERGQLEEAIAGMRQGLAAMWAGGTGFGIPCHLLLLAGVYGKAGQAAQGLELIAEALHLARSTGESWEEAELHRVKGELLLSASDRDEAVAGADVCFRRAIDVARTQEAKLWELRAATSLARLRTQQGRRAEAHNLLAPIYGWFTEGFDTADLKNAKALIDELRLTGPDLG